MDIENYIEKNTKVIILAGEYYSMDAKISEQKHEKQGINTVLPHKTVANYKGKKKLCSGETDGQILSPVRYTDPLV